MKNYFFTSESVTEGHPDKLCDQISDAVLDEMIRKDPESRVACETCITTGAVVVMGEFSSCTTADISSVVRRTIEEVGYTNADSGFNARSCAVISMLNKQSGDISLGVDRSLEAKNGNITPEDSIGAGDQGMVFGYACNETKELMPLPISLAHKLSRSLDMFRKSGKAPYLKPDGKSQVTVEYVDGKPYRIDTIVLSAQHSRDISAADLTVELVKNVVLPAMPSELIDSESKIYVNPTGRFIVGGPTGDSGLTGRKIIVDTYGGYAKHGGGAFSGKDPTKVDRSAAYAARYAAKNIVCSQVADRCEIQVSYAIGMARPVSIAVNTFGTGKYSDEKITEAVREIFDFRPAAIIRTMHLRSPIYRPLAVYGHMGREDLNVAWESTDQIEAIIKFLG